MKHAAFALALAGTCTAPLAADGPWYMGGALGVPYFDGCPSAASCDESDLAYKVFGGYRFNRHIALEAGYTDLGKTTVTAADSLTEIKPRGVTAHMVGLWPLTDRFSLVGRLGMIYGDTKVTGTAPTHNDKGVELAWGVGAQFDVTREIVLRLEWERFHLRDSVDAVTLGIIARF